MDKEEIRKLIAEHDDKKSEGHMATRAFLKNIMYCEEPVVKVPDSEKVKRLLAISRSVYARSRNLKKLYEKELESSKELMRRNKGFGLGLKRAQEEARVLRITNSSLVNTNKNLEDEVNGLSVELENEREKSSSLELQIEVKDKLESKKVKDLEAQVKLQEDRLDENFKSVLSYKNKMDDALEERDKALTQARAYANSIDEIRSSSDHRSVEDLRGKLKKSQDKVVSLKEDVDWLKKHRDRVTEQRDNIIQDKIELERLVELYKSKSHEAVKNLEAEVEELKEALEKKDVTIESHKEEISSLLEVANEHEKLSSVERDLERVRERHLLEEKENQRLRAVLKQQQERICELNKELSELRNATKVDQLQVEINRLNSELAKEKEKSSLLRAQKELIRIDCKAKLDKKNHEVLALEENLNEQVNVNKKTVAQRNDVSILLEEVEAENADLEVIVSDFDSRLKDINQEREKLSEELKNYKEENETLYERVKYLEGEAVSAGSFFEERVGELEANIESLEEKFKTQKKRADEAEEKHADAFCRWKELNDAKHVLDLCSVKHPDKIVENRQRAIEEKANSLYFDQVTLHMDSNNVKDYINRNNKSISHDTCLRIMELIADIVHHEDGFLVSDFAELIISRVLDLNREKFFPHVATNERHLECFYGIELLNFIKSESGPNLKYPVYSLCPESNEILVELPNSSSPSTKSQIAALFEERKEQDRMRKEQEEYFESLNNGDII